MHSADWTGPRSRMLLAPEVAYLNTGSFGPLPRCVFERVTDLRRQLAEEPTDFMLCRVPSLCWQARERLAQFVGGDPCRLMLTTNVSVAVNLVASSLRPGVRGEILMTDHEYETMRWCWERAADRLGCTIRTVSLPAVVSGPGEIVDAVAAAMTTRTRLLFFSHVLSTTGLILPARELCAEARRRGIVSVVDGAHAPAFLDLDLNRIAADFYAGSGHKWLLAPAGTGFLYLGPESLDWLEPTFVSWGFRDAASTGPPDERDRYGSTPRLRRFECQGTRDLCPWLVLPEVINFQVALGQDRIRARMRQLAEYTYERLADVPSLVPTTPRSPTLHGGITAFQLPAGTDATVLRRQLREQFRVQVAVIERPDGRLLIRASTHFFNTKAEVDRLEGALRVLLR